MADIAVSHGALILPSPEAKATIGVNTAVPRLAPLTSLRFFAAALIVIQHTRGFFGVPVSFLAPLVLEQGVSFFYVLSGFILAYNYRALDTATTRRFYVARVARIWPMHVAALVFALAIILHDPSTSISPIFLLALGLNLFLLNTWIPREQFTAAGTGVAWSLGVEVFFYLCFPWLLSRWRQTWAWKFALVFVLTGAGITFANHFQRAFPPPIGSVFLTYYSPPMRLAEFLVGMAAARLFLAWEARWVPPRGLVTIIEMSVATLVVIVAYYSRAWSAGLAHIPTIGVAGGNWLRTEGLIFVPFAFLITVLAAQRGILSWLLSCKPLVFLGEISFSLYLLHAVLLRFYERYPARFLPIPTPLLYPFYWIVVLLSSTVAYTFVEMPCRRLILRWWDARSSQAATPRTVQQPWRRHPLSFFVNANPMGIGAAGLLLPFLILVLVQPSLPPLDRVTLSSTPARCGLLIAGGGAQQATPDASGKLRVSHNEMLDGTLVFYGWAAASDGSGLARGVWMSIGNGKPVEASYGIVQRYIADYFHDDRLVRSGFVSTVKIGTLPPGEYPIVLDVVSPDGKHYDESRIYSLIIADA